MNYITYSETARTYCLTSKEVGQAMIAMGNPYGHNRGARITDIDSLLASLKRAGFREV